MDIPLQAPSPTPLPANLWTEIPNYGRLVFHPIALPMDHNETINATDSPKPLRRHSTSNDMQDLQAQMKRQSLSETNLLALRTPVPATREPADMECEQLAVDAEISNLTLALAPKPEKVIARRCHAPTPLSMMRGKSTPDMTSYLIKRDKMAPGSPAPNLKLEPSPKSRETAPSLKANKKTKKKRREPPRPEGLPPLNLGVIKRSPSNDISAAATNPTIMSPTHLISPRVQKPPTPRRCSEPGPQLAFAPCPDFSRAMPSIQSPRSAFSARDLVLRS